MSTPTVPDTESARLFMEEALAGVEDHEIDAICSDLGAKSRFFQSKLIDGSDFGADDVQLILRSVFATRRRAKKVVTQFGAETLKHGMIALVKGSGDLEGRLQEFFDLLEGMPESHRNDLATELLHFTDPQQYWLWTRWMWDPKTNTGAIPLLVSDDFQLDADSVAARYKNVGRAIAYVQSVSQAADFRLANRGIFATDVYLSFVYVIYAYTVLRMRMTKEFNRVMPQLPEFSRRLLGINQATDYAC